jgi:hypothetical protein
MSEDDKRLEELDLAIWRTLRRAPPPPAPPNWLAALLLSLTDEEVVQLYQACQAEMNERVIRADSGDPDHV